MVEEAVKDEEIMVDAEIGVEGVVVVDAVGGEDHAEAESLSRWVSFEPSTIRDAVSHHYDTYRSACCKNNYDQAENCCLVVACLVREWGLPAITA